MAFLRIAGLPVPVQTDASGSPAVTVGEKFYSAAGNLRTTIRRTYFEWSVTTAPLTDAEYQALLAAAPHGAEAIVSGTMLGGDGGRAVLCDVFYGSTGFLAVEGGESRRIVSIELRQKWRMGVLSGGVIVYAPEAGSGVVDPATLPGSEGGTLVTITDPHTDPPIAENPKPRFVVRPRTGHRQTSFQLDATGSIGGIYKTFRWKLGDGTTKTGPVINHIYGRDGVFTPVLELTDEYGRATVAGSITVDSTLAPRAGFRIDPSDRQPPGTTIHITPEGASALEGFYEYFMGDPEAGYLTADDDNPEVTYEYQSAGMFTIRQLVTDINGFTAETSRVIEVAVDPGLLKAVLKVSPSSADVGEEVEADASESDGDIASYAISWGDGTPNSTDSTATHAYLTEGVKPITLTVTHTDGRTAQATRSITIAPAGGPERPFIDALDNMGPYDELGNGTVFLSGSIFEHEDPTATHEETEWQLAINDTFSSPFYDEISDTDLVEHWVSGLGPDFTYYARARYRDNRDLWSDWSHTIQFQLDSADTGWPEEPDGPTNPDDPQGPEDPGEPPFPPEPPTDPEDVDEDAPAKPVITIANPAKVPVSAEGEEEPEDQVIFGNTARLASSAFNPPDADTHHSTRWQVVKVAELEEGEEAPEDPFATPAFDSGWSTAYKLAYSVFGLAFEETYLARCAHRGSPSDLSSEWSEPVRFKCVVKTGDPETDPTNDDSEIWRQLDENEVGLGVLFYDFRYAAELEGGNSMVGIRDPRTERTDLPRAGKTSGGGPGWSKEQGMVFSGSQGLFTNPSKAVADAMSGEDACIVVVAKVTGGGADAQIARLNGTGSSDPVLRLAADFPGDAVVAKADSGGVVLSVEQEDAQIALGSHRRLLYAYRSATNLGVFLQTEARDDFENLGVALSAGSDPSSIVIGLGATMELQAVLFLKHKPTETQMDLIEAWAVAKHNVSFEAEAPGAPAGLSHSQDHWWGNTTLQITDPFSDPDESEQAGVQWEIYEDEALTELRHDTGWLMDPADFGSYELTEEDELLDWGTTYWVRARAKDDAGQVSGWSEPYELATLVAPAAPAVSDITSSGTLKEDISITFTAVHNVAAEDIEKIDWDWGNANSLAGTNPMANTWANPGTYSVQALITDKGGRTGQRTESFVIAAANVIALGTTGLKIADSFNRANGSPGSNWSSSASFSIDTNRIKKTTASPQNLAAVPMNGVQYGVVQVKVNTANWNSDIGFLLKNAGGGNTYQAFLGSNTGGGTKSVTFGKSVGGAFTAISSAVYSFALNTDYTIKVEMKAGSQKIWINGSLVLSTTDTTYNANTGDWALYGFLRNTGALAYFDDFVGTNSNVVTCTGLPTGHKLQVAGPTTLTATESGGTASIDCGGTSFPFTSVSVLNASNVVIATLSTNVYGGDAFTFTP